ncbi:MAG: PEP-CTERM sorting domain-containing protein [Phycisphaeraceae bacterium]|nr:PEP-CTERM sorting domain-containing protein [Phycisphaeraceae bacterium]
MKNVHFAAAAGLIVAMSGIASAELLHVTITADNHYALYTSTSSLFSYIGGNELGSAGNPGTYNWSLPETYEFDSGERVFIAAWSDDSVAQGVLAQVFGQAEQSMHSGNPAWEVYRTGLNRGDNDPHPTIEEIAGHVLTADSLNLWEVPFVGEENGVEPWGTVPDIATAARWMWWNTPGDSDPLRGGSGAGEMLIFGMRIPTPGTLSLAGLGGFCLARRRRG